MTHFSTTGFEAANGSRRVFSVGCKARHSEVIHNRQAIK